MQGSEAGCEGGWAGKDRSKLRIKDPAKFSWKPLELLMLIARIYLNLYRADAHAIARAIASDGQSYTDDMFGTAIEVGRWGIVSQAVALSPPL